MILDMPFRDIGPPPRLTLATKPAFDIVAGEVWSGCTVEVMAISAGEPSMLVGATTTGEEVGLLAVNGYLCLRDSCVTSGRYPRRQTVFHLASGWLLYDYRLMTTQQPRHQAPETQQLPSPR